MLKDLEPQAKVAYEKIANMKIMNVANTSIADVIGVSESDISQILKKPEYLEIYSHLMQTKFAELQETDESWDTVERKAIKRVSEVLAFSADPEFALKAATVANKAQRRGKGLHNDPLPAVAGTRVAISFSNNYVDKLQMVMGANSTDQGPIINAEPEKVIAAVAEVLPTKLTNSLPTSAVKKLFGADEEDRVQRGRETTGDMIDQIFANPLLMGA